MSNRTVKKCAFIGLGFCVLAWGSPADAKIIIDIDYTYDTNGFFTDPVNGASAKAALNRAAQTFSDRILDNLTTVSNVAGENGGDWSATFKNPATGANVTKTDLTVAANVIKVYAGGRVLGGNTLGIGGPGGLGYSYYPSVPASVAWKDNVLSRGQSGALATPATDFARWGGTITFDTASNWHFGLTTAGLTGSKNDFLSVATHELAHLLGFGTAASFAALNSGGYYTGAKTTALAGGNVQLNPSDLAHFVAGTMSMVGGVAQETAMSPSIVTGSRKNFTLLDFAAMDDYGWDLARGGDANADGTVDFLDLVTLAQNYGVSTGTKHWSEGDFTYDGNVDFQDLVSLAQNYGFSGPQPSTGVLTELGGTGFASDWQAALTSVPEPAGAIWLLGASGLLVRRRAVAR